MKKLIYTIFESTIIISSVVGIMSFTKKQSGYLQVSAQFVAKYDGYKKGVNEINAAKDTIGNYYVSVNTYYDFPELFPNIDTMEVHYLYPESFPQQSLIK